MLNLKLNSKLVTKIWRKIKRQIPADCLVCEDFAMKDMDLCNQCFSQIKLNENSCAICSEPFYAEEFTSSTYIKKACGACSLEAPMYEKMLTFFLYQPPLEQILWGFKFKANILAGNLLLELLLQKQPQAPVENCLIISMPKNINHDYALNLDSVHWFAKKLAKNWKCNFLDDKSIIRKTNVPAQRGLTLKQRSKNMRKAWVFSEDIKNKLQNQNLLLLDDVATTGASLNFLAKELLKFKPKSINALCILRTQKAD